MADMTTDLPRERTLTSAFRLRAFQWLLLVLLSCGCWVAVNEATAKDRCETIAGRLAVRFKMDSYFSNCQLVAIRDPHPAGWWMSSSIMALLTRTKSLDEPRGAYRLRDSRRGVGMSYRRILVTEGFRRQRLELAI